MKRKLAIILTCLLLAALTVLPVSAKSPRVLDYANLMTSEEDQYLEQWCGQFDIHYAMDIVLLTVPTTMDFSPQDFADNFYENNGYADDGLIFLLDMGSRQWHISTSGTAIEALSDRDLEKIEQKVIPYFSEGKYFDGFCKFLDILPDHLAEESGVNIFLAALIGAGIAGIVLFIMRGAMNTRRPQRSADTYEIDGSYHLNTHQDLFLYSRLSKRAKPKESSSGSTTHRSSSGTSHGGRGGSF